MVYNIRPTDEIVSITGVSSVPIIVNTIADTEHFGTVYFSEEVTANIISLSNIEKIMSVNQIKDKRDFTIAFSAESREKPGNKLMFEHRSSGLYAYTGFKITNVARAYVLKVQDKKRLYSKKQRLNAEKALLLRQRLGYPNIQQFKKMIVSSTLMNLDIIGTDV